MSAVPRTTVRPTRPLPALRERRAANRRVGSFATGSPAIQSASVFVAGKSRSIFSWTAVAIHVLRDTLPGICFRRRSMVLYVSGDSRKFERCSVFIPSVWRHNGANTTAKWGGVLVLGAFGATIARASQAYVSTFRHVVNMFPPVGPSHLAENRFCEVMEMSGRAAICNSTV